MRQVEATVLQDRVDSNILLIVAKSIFWLTVESYDGHSASIQNRFCEKMGRRAARLSRVEFMTLLAIESQSCLMER